jgi:serine/threonine-protein kinase HipA
MAQLVFWLLAATDGHGTNFLLHQQAGGTFSLTPFYDVLSAWPMIGSGRNRHYRLVEIQARMDGKQVYE